MRFQVTRRPIVHAVIDLEPEELDVVTLQDSFEHRHSLLVVVLITAFCSIHMLELLVVSWQDDVRRSECQCNTAACSMRLVEMSSNVLLYVACTYDFKCSPYGKSTFVDEECVWAESVFFEKRGVAGCCFLGPLLPPHWLVGRDQLSFGTPGCLPRLSVAKPDFVPLGSIVIYRIN